MIKENLVLLDLDESLKFVMPLLCSDVESFYSAINTIIEFLIGESDMSILFQSL